MSVTNKQCAFSKVDIQVGWVDLYEAAVFELNPNKPPARVDVARNAINARVAELSKDADNAGEMRRLSDAARTLEMLLRIEGPNSNDQIE